MTATDKAGNTAAAEFTFYVDRTAPTISLISPVNGSTFDSNAVFTVRADDNHDTELYCTLETNVNASDSSTLTSGVESNISLTLPLGALAWHVTCSDDAGNTAESDTYYGTAVDMTGPVISIKDVSYVVRGHDLNINATITDISGVGSATATFNGNTIALSKSGDYYTGAITVAAGTALGNYTFTVDANDTNGYASSASDTFEVIEGYTIKITLPKKVEPGAAVSVTGTVKEDNGTKPSGNVTIEYTGGNASATLTAGDYSYSFTAPGTDGTYTVKVKYETSRFIYTAEDTYKVETKKGGGGGGKKSSLYQSFSVTTEGAGITPTVQESSNSELQTEESEQTTQNTETPPTQENTPELPPAASGSPIAGQATGILNALGQTVKWGALLGALLALGIAFYLAYRGRKPGSKIDWKNYFD